MKVLFLDIDGVLLPFGGEHAADYHSTSIVRFSEESMDALSEILEAVPDVEIVLSSTWRCAGGDQAVLSAFANYVRDRNPRSRVAALVERGAFSYTTCPHTHSYRQWEIAEWLASPDARGVTAWCALDYRYLIAM